MFLAIDRVSKFTYVEFHDSAGKMEGSTFLKAVVEVFPYKIHTVLTDERHAPSPICPRIARAPAAASSARTSSTASAWQTP